MSVWAAAAPALIVTAPLIGMSLQGDERRQLYRAVHRFSGNPLWAARTALRDVDNYLDAGNFRPVGRFVQGFLHSLVFDASEFTGIAPHTTLGLTRVVMVFVLVLVCTRMVAALARSAGVTRDAPILALYPLALGATLVANGTEGALTQFSPTFIGAVVLIVATALATARDQDMDTRPLRWHEPIAMFLFGAVTATFYDLVYVAPALALAYIAVRAGASLTPFRHALRTAALRRWVALSSGFLAVLVPVRIGIARRCSSGSCYDGSDLSLSAEAVEVALFRSLGSTPPPPGRLVCQRIPRPRLRTGSGSAGTTHDLSVGPRTNRMHCIGRRRGDRSRDALNCCRRVQPRRSGGLVPAGVTAPSRGNRLIRIDHRGAARAGYGSLPLGAADTPLFLVGMA